MVFVKVRETYDLHTVKNKMTVIAIHTPKPNIIKRNFPGLLMQCRAYRPVSADVRLACASVLPLDPLGVGLSENDVAPEDMFNPILYKAMSNKGMSQLEARINFYNANSAITIDVDGATSAVETDNVTNVSDEFPIYYGLLSNAHDWKHANPQSGLSMSKLRPLVYEMVYNVGDTQVDGGSTGMTFGAPQTDGKYTSVNAKAILGKAKEFPFLNCLSYTGTDGSNENYPQLPGFNLSSGMPANEMEKVPWLNVVCGCIIVPPSRLHELFYRMVVEWTIEFSSIRPLSEITDWSGLANVGYNQHYQNYSYEATKEVVTGSDETILSNDACMVSSNVEVEKVM